MEKDKIEATTSENNKETLFTDIEVSAIIKETQKGFPPKSIEMIDTKVPTSEQIELVLKSEINTAHKLSVLHYMNVDSPSNVINDFNYKQAGLEPPSSKNYRPNMAQQKAEKFSQNLQNGTKNLSVD